MDVSMPARSSHYAVFSMQRSRRGPRGMTLVEVMMAFAILITGLVGVFAILHAGFRSHRRAINETESVQVASSIVSELRADFFRAHVPPSDPQGAWHQSPDYPDYKYRKVIVPLESGRKGVNPTVADREYFVRVEVRWSDQGENKSISVDTVMYCNRK
jgi:type II secretory pathway pseudopilin PulG